MRKRPAYKNLADGLLRGEIIPFFGAAASAVCRPDGARWTERADFLPFGSELANHLIDWAEFPREFVDVLYEAVCEDVKGALGNTAPALKAAIHEAVVADVRTVLSDPPGESQLTEKLKDTLDTALNDRLATLADSLNEIFAKHLRSPPPLPLIASWVCQVQTSRPRLNSLLRRLFSIKASPGKLHNKLAQIDAIPLYLTTNYDDLLEQALAPRQPHLLVDQLDRGLWVGTPGTKLDRIASIGTELYDRLDDPDTKRPARPILFKLHGSIDRHGNNPRNGSPNDGYLITEDDYVAFLGRAGGIPPYIGGLLEGKELLFIGYSLEDWNVRVILRRFLQNGKGYAVVRGRSHIEQEVWASMNIDIYSMDLREFTDDLIGALDASAGG